MAAQPCTCRRHARCPSCLGMLEPVVLESWRVVDRWWTAEPVCREYRTVATAKGPRTEYQQDGGPWVEVQVA